MSKEKSTSRNLASDSSLLSRRDVLIGVGAATAFAYSGNLMSATSEHNHEHMHDHSKHTPQQPDLLNAVNVCVDKGQKCISHCMVTFVEGNTDLAVCAAKAYEMHAVCTAYSTLLTANSSYLMAYTKVAEMVLKDCETECLKHKKHLECKACAEACADVIDQIKLRMS